MVFGEPVQLTEHLATMAALVTQHSHFFGAALALTRFLDNLNALLWLLLSPLRLGLAAHVLTLDLLLKFLPHRH